MKLTPVDQIPKMNGYHKLQELIEEFTNGDAIPCCRDVYYAAYRRFFWLLSKRRD